MDEGRVVSFRGYLWLLLALTPVYLALAVLGLISQLRAISGRHRSMRQQWGSSRLVAPAH